jgi:phosphoglycolate phosphatase-like HAD superfamily hydrolase
LKSLQAIVFFDLDNTLVEIQNSHLFFDSIIIDVFKGRDIEPPKKEERDKLWRDANYKFLLREWNYPDPVDFWRRFDNIDLKKRKELFTQGSLTLFEDVFPVLKKISESGDICMILITNSSKKIVEFELTAFDLKQYFDIILALGDTQDDCKPNPKKIIETLAYLAEEFHFSNERVFIVGDSPFDISAGKNANIKSILVRRKDFSKRKFPDEPDYYIKNMNEILSILNL